ncbi:hypothetical protein NZD88_07765 [Chryseobacterium antibioticum]|uniref:Uncharacterized protein n=1 Tax=Chryseobacterium pyrolae TaxID=2987481 RepID=A0ABT2IFL3_9FLAO|nr:hypothetical protein [Chryseobacterium pyrolae]MCT2407430.1 hypothetical protein [Chryseobacterium pyrolae]
MKRSYFIFYGSAVAYCISMLAALQIGSFSITSSAAKGSPVSNCCPDMISSYEYMTGDYAEYSVENSTVSFDFESYNISFGDKIFAKIRTSRERNPSESGFKNIPHFATGNFNHIHSPVGYASPDKICSFITLHKLYTRHQSFDPIDADVTIEDYKRSSRYPMEDSKSLGGFNLIIEFPDKIS